MESAYLQGAASLCSSRLKCTGVAPTRKDWWGPAPSLSSGTELHLTGSLSSASPLAHRPKSLLSNFYICLSINSAVHIRKRKKGVLYESFQSCWFACLLSVTSLPPQCRGVCIQSSLTHIDVKEGQYPLSALCRGILLVVPRQSNQDHRGRPCGLRRLGENNRDQIRIILSCMPFFETQGRNLGNLALLHF